MYINVIVTLIIMIYMKKMMNNTFMFLILSGIYKVRIEVLGIDEIKFKVPT